MTGELNLGSDWDIIGNNGGNLIIEHTPTGNTHTLNANGTTDVPDSLSVGGTQIADSNGNVTGTVDTDSVTTKDVDTAVAPYIPPTIDGMTNPFSFSDEIPEIPIPDSDFVEVRFTQIEGSIGSDSDIYLQFSSDGGGSWLSTSYNYTVEQISNGGADFSSNSSSATRVFIGHVNNGRGNSPLTLEFSTPRTGARTQMSWHGALNPGGANITRVLGSAIHDGFESIDRIRLFQDDGSGGIDNMNALDGLVVIAPGGAL